LPFSKGAVVFAPGYRILSLKPADTCPELYSFLSGLEGGTGGQRLCRFDTRGATWVAEQSSISRYQPIFDSIAEICGQEKNYYLRMSGTSMATPLVSHMAAETWVDHPEITKAEDLIPLLTKGFAMERPTDPALARGVPAGSLSPKVPSWYGTETFFTTGWDPLEGVRGSAPAAVSSPQEIKVKTDSGTTLKLKFTPTIGVLSDGGTP
jgi:subtilisin family serine protease